MSFGIGYNIKSKVRVCTPELLEQALDSVQVAHTCAEIEDVLEKYRRGELNKEDFETLKGELKKRLPIATFHATFTNGRRKNEEAIPSGLCIYDLDHIPNPREKWAEIEARKDELRILLAHITPSTEGLRLVFVIPTVSGENRLMTLAEAQAWMASMLGDTQYDACVKDYARCSFLVPREYVLFMSDRLFKTTGVILRNEETKNLETQSGCTQILRDAQDDKTESDAQDDKDNVPQDDKKKEYPQTFKGIPYGTIIAEWFRKNGGEPVQGERNAKLHRLASHLRYITDNNEVHLLQIIPSFGLKEEEMRTLIHSACIAKFYGMPRSFKQMLAGLNGEESEIVSHKSETNIPPEMPKKLPPLIKLLVSKTPKIYQPAVAHAVFPALATHLWKVKFRYIDNVEHEATLMNVLMAGTGAGKSCICEPINRIMADIRKRDKENMEREREWKREVNAKASNKDKRQRPEGLVIQEIDPDVTNAAFVQRLADSDGRFLYCQVNEIDQFDSLRTSTNKNAQFQIMCLAFDPGNVYGQTRIGTGSVTERVCVRFNFNASTTIQKGRAYFRNVLIKGPVSRLNFSYIPDREIGADMPVFGTYDASFDEELRPYIERLNNARGLIECKQAFRLASKLKDKNAEFARLSQSRVYENLSFRANVIAYLKAMVLYVAHGYWDKTMEDFVRWSLEYDLWCKLKFFGNAIEEAMREDIPIRKVSGPQNLLDLLPEVFTFEEADLLRRQMEMQQGNATRNMLYQWLHRGYILRLTPDSYKKSDKYKRREPCEG
ncbi:MAG: VirE protein [Bacteroides sp.]|nr:VirE protein [Bacteroides sp.]